MGLFDEIGCCEEDFKSNQAITRALQSPYRPLNIMVRSSALFKAHWSFWVPTLEGPQGTKGKRAHVVGSVLEGFQIEFVRNYDLCLTGSHPVIFEIGAMRTEDLQDTFLDGQCIEEKTTRDRFEAIAVSVPAPRGSLNHVNERSHVSEASQQAITSATAVASSQDTGGQPPPVSVCPLMSVASYTSMSFTMDNR